MVRSSRWGFRVSLFGVLALLALPARAAVVEPDVVESGSVIVTAESAEVREGPSARYEVITVVEEGEIFLKQGRTRGWYYIKLNGDSFGWISGRAISRYRAGEAPAPEIDRYETRFYPYYPGPYYDSYWWGYPYFSWEWYFYDRPWRPRDRPWDFDRYRPRDWDKKPPQGDGQDGGKFRPRGDDRGDDKGRPRDDSGRGDWQRGKDPNPSRDSGPGPGPRSPSPRFR